MLKCYASSNGNRNKQIEGKLNAQQMENEGKRCEEHKFDSNKMPSLFLLIFFFHFAFFLALYLSVL